MDSRIAELQAALRGRKLDYLIVSSEPNLLWLTGKNKLGATLLIPFRGEPTIISTEFEYLRIPKQLKLKMSHNWWRTIARNAHGRIGYEDDQLSEKTLLRARKIIKGKLVPASDILTRLRSIKTEEEIARIRKAAKVAVAGMTAVAKALRPGITERQLATVAEAAMRCAGADWYSFETILASGARTASPHEDVSDRKIGPKDLVVVDIGARVDGWCSDMTRTFCLKPGTKEREIYGTVLKMRAAELKKIKVGTKASAVDRAGRDVARKLGLHKAFTHGSGHGLGVEVHESPSFSPRSKYRLKPNMVFTIEPGLYFSGWGGVRIEDMFLLTKKGPRLLTNFPRKLIST
jgi:Xaa-Pro aminopeptidase